MWMGTYPVLPSYVKATGEDLQDVLDKYPNELVGEQMIKKFGHTKLPYLPKVLSIAKALPLQVHPNKELSAKLHKENPDDFTDPNHKPEIALALTKFEAFCGFKPNDQIAYLMKLDCMHKFLPDTMESEFSKEAVKKVVRNILNADEDALQATYDALTAAHPASFGPDTYIPELAPRLAEQYDSKDPGVLVALITMNFLTLNPGEAIYIPADGIHAYLSGDIIECMARSNNVLNTGFCPKAERASADLFVSTLTFAPHSKEQCMLLPKPYQGSKNGKTEILAPPMSEFDMLQMTLQSGEKDSLVKVEGNGILLATKGSATMTANGQKAELKEGQVYFIAPGVELEFEAGKDGLLLHEAYCH
jgi:mannose-6-phosphate isomerase